MRFVVLENIVERTGPITISRSYTVAITKQIGNTANSGTPSGPNLARVFFFFRYSLPRDPTNREPVEDVRILRPRVYQGHVVIPWRRGVKSTSIFKEG